MLKRIPVRQLRPGMHVHEFCGSWLDHPFWRAKFLLKDASDLARIRATSITELWIDTERGLILVKGAVPGAKGALVVIRTAAKGA